VEFIWKPTNLPTRNYAALEQDLKRNPGKAVLLNHFENNRAITTKHGLLRHLKLYYAMGEASQAGYSVFDSTPTSFVLTAGIEDKDFHELVRRCQDIEKGHLFRERMPGKHVGQNIWLLKPVNLNQGRGI
jgi:hypothetical protein